MVSSKSGNFMRYYMNGELIAQQAVALEFFPNFNDSAGYALRIGPEMIGAMDEFRLWRGVRTQAAIRADMYRTLTGSESGLRLYYKFEEPTIGTVVNSAKATGTAYDGAYVSGSVARMSQAAALQQSISPIAWETSPSSIPTTPVPAPSGRP